MNTPNCNTSQMTLHARAATDPRRGWWSLSFALALWLAAAPMQPVQAATALSDQPVFTNTAVPGNLVLALSVEFPTAVSRAIGQGGSLRVSGYRKITFAGSNAVVLKCS